MALPEQIAAADTHARRPIGSGDLAEARAEALLGGAHLDVERAELYRAARLAARLGGADAADAVTGTVPGRPAAITHRVGHDALEVLLGALWHGPDTARAAAAGMSLLELAAARDELARRRGGR